MSPLELVVTWFIPTGEPSPPPLHSPWEAAAALGQHEHHQPSATCSLCHRPTTVEHPPVQEPGRTISPVPVGSVTPRLAGELRLLPPRRQGTGAGGDPSALGCRQCRRTSQSRRSSWVEVG